MALVQCGECGHEVSTSAPMCPHCGKPKSSVAGKKCDNCRLASWDDCGGYDCRYGFTVKMGEPACIGFKKKDPEWW